MTRPPLPSTPPAELRRSLESAAASRAATTDGQAARLRRIPRNRALAHYALADIERTVRHAGI